MKIRSNYIRKANLLLTATWILIIPISIATNWIYSIAFVSAASIYANAISHLSAWRADDPDDEIMEILERVKKIEERLGE